MKRVSMVVTFEVPDQTRDDDVLFEVRSYLPDIDTSGMWSLTGVEFAPAWGGSS